MLKNSIKPPCTVHQDSLSHLLQAIKSHQNFSSELLAPRFRFLIPGSTKVRVVKNLVSAAESQNLIQAVENLGFSFPTAFDRSVRACERRHTIDPGMSHAIMSRLSCYLPEIVNIDDVRWRLKRFTHHWRYVKYFPKGHFIPHYDGAKMLRYPLPAMTVFTVQIYLNDDFSGGETRFYADYETVRQASHDIPLGEVREFKPANLPTHQVKPEKGSVLIFDHVRNVLHDAAEVQSGVKYILRGDVLYEVLEEDVPKLLINAAIKDPKTLNWCLETAIKYGTRNYIGEVWVCDCACDGLGSIPQDKSSYLNTEEDASSQSSIEEEEIVNSTEKVDIPNHSTCENRRSLVPILVSGKRASGKDYISNLIYQSLTEKNLSVYRTSLGSINKRLYAASIGIDATRLERDRAFKESHRLAMIEHHMKRNAQDPEWCLRAVVTNAEQANAQILLLSDIRTRQDLAWFRQQFDEVVLLRITASDAARRARGWEPCPEKDSLPTETDLDGVLDWTACWDNSDFSTKGHALLHEWIENTVIPRIPLPNLQNGCLGNDSGEK